MSTGFVNGVLPLLIICTILLIIALVYYYLDDANRTYYGVGIAIALAILPAVIVWVVCVLLDLNDGSWAIVSWLLPFVAGVASLILGVRHLVKTRRESDKETSEKLLKDSPAKKNSSKVKPPSKSYSRSDSEPETKTSEELSAEKSQFAQKDQMRQNDEINETTGQDTSEVSQSPKNSKESQVNADRDSLDKAELKAAFIEAEVEELEAEKIVGEIEAEKDQRFITEALEEGLLEFEETSNWEETSQSSASLAKKSKTKSIKNSKKNTTD